MNECKELWNYFNSLPEFSSGAYGEVKIYDTPTGKYVVKKIMVEEKTFTNEVNILKHLEKSTITPRYITSVFCKDESDYGFIIMERINGITLEKYLKTSNKTLTDKELQVIALKIRLLHYIH